MNSMSHKLELAMHPAGIKMDTEVNAGIILQQSVIHSHNRTQSNEIWSAKQNAGDSVGCLSIYNFFQKLSLKFQSEIKICPELF